jgi:anaerobic ribonucleoside-triphosphate reductase
MNIKTSYEKDFTNFIKRMNKKYGDELFNIEGIGKQLDINEFSKQLFTKTAIADKSVDANANVTEFTPAIYMHELCKPHLKLNSYYMLWKQLRLLYNTSIAEQILEDQINGRIYINDFHLISSKQAYCFNFTCLDIINKGLPFINKIRTVPPKHLYSFKSQLEQFIVYASNSIAGATGVADIFVCMSWYIDNILKTKTDAGFKFKSEKDIWKYVEETIVSFIYTINQPFRSGVQSAFTNVSVYDKHFLENLLSDYVFPDKRTPEMKTIQKVQTIFLDIMNKEHKRTPLTFPVVTACFSIDKENNIQDEDFLKLIVKKNKEFGFINIYMGDSATLSSCCRLRSGTDNPYFNSFGGASSSIGSLGVCTINLPRLAYETKDKVKFLKELAKRVETTSRVNHAKRTFLKKAAIEGFLPLYHYDFINLTKQYSTTGLTGVNEALEILGFSILEKDGQDYLEAMLGLINKLVDKYQDKYDAPHNVEQVPSENSGIKLALKDKLLGFNKEYEMYSNQFIPLTVNANLLDRIELQGKYDKMFSGGAICHLNIESKIENDAQMASLIKHAAKRGVIYFAINFNLQECEDGHMTVGLNEKCSICGGEIINNFTRVVGFLTNTKNWNKVRRKLDYPKRVFYK